MKAVIQQLSPSEFPSLLKEIPDPPEKLFIRGTLPREDTSFLTVVGSRKYTPYGRQVVEYLIGGLRGYPVVVVSGLALGIDTLAHKAALDANLQTIAVPGSGLDPEVLYPRSNHALAEAIVNAGGALLSEFEPSFQATPWSFPKRNRIMAGMSHATLLIEASERSGTLITARLATEYNRDLLAIPNSIFAASSRGNHQFLKLGACLVENTDDILDALGLLGNTPVETSYDNLSEDEKRVVEIIQTPCTRDDLISALGLSVTDANILLSTMELKGLIKEEMGVVRLCI